MGFFDVRCQVSGISSFRKDLEGALLVEREGRLAPLSVLVRGTSNRLGGIDMIKPTALIDASFEALHAFVRDGRLAVDVPQDDLRSLAAYRREHAQGGPEGAHGFEWLFSVVAYGTWNGVVALRLDGRPVSAVLAVPRMIDAAVEMVEGRAGKDPLDGATLDALLDAAFDAGTPAREIHGRLTGELADRRAARKAFGRLARLRAFLEERGGARAPEQEQDTEETEAAAAEAAFAALSGMPPFRRALSSLFPKLFRERAAALDRLDGAKAQGASRPYDPASSYRSGELVTHARFGEGVVIEDPRDGRVEIDFPSGRRKLVCGKG
ncbi:MAG TPA: hypothetical protein VLS89_20950 [Candidatus Nanopelagicales bacterium]|nr:hypothetical protein [Candidatus Nanopelagicales bacterium]